MIRLVLVRHDLISPDLFITVAQERNLTRAGYICMHVITWIFPSHHRSTR
ncbi:hypothetical protein [Pseudomonas sp. Leaf127]|nr:hypothetical protein [Pseudomonas sp. Leaf127]